MQSKDDAEQLRAENAQLRGSIARILEELEQKAPIIEAQRQEYERAVSAHASVTQRLEEASAEVLRLLFLFVGRLCCLSVCLSRLRGCKLNWLQRIPTVRRTSVRPCAWSKVLSFYFCLFHMRLLLSVCLSVLFSSTRSLTCPPCLRTETTDLGRQVQLLLKDQVAPREASLSLQQQQPGSPSGGAQTTAEDVITEHLITFRNIEVRDVCYWDAHRVLNIKRLCAYVYVCLCVYLCLCVCLFVACVSVRRSCNCATSS